MIDRLLRVRSSTLSVSSGCGDPVFSARIRPNSSVTSAIAAIANHMSVFRVFSGAVILSDGSTMSVERKDPRIGANLVIRRGSAVVHSEPMDTVCRKLWR